MVVDSGHAGAAAASLVVGAHAAAHRLDASPDGLHLSREVHVLTLLSLRQTQPPARLVAPREHVARRHLESK